MASSSSTGISGDKLQKCVKHQNEEIKFYCLAHENFGCNTCITLSHKLCETAYIPEVSEKFSTHFEYLHYEKCIQDLKESCAVNICKLEADIVRIEKQYTNVMSEIKKRRQEVQVYLDKVQLQLEDEALAFKKTNQDLMRSLKSAYESVAQQIVNTEYVTSQLKKDKKYNALFCEVKQARKKISEIHSRAYEISTRYQKQECKFQQRMDLQTTKNMFGAIEIEEMYLGPCNTSESLQTQPLCHINIKSDNDKKTCYATGLAFISSDQLAVADKMNRVVKIVDFGNDKIISEIKLSSCPHDVTAISPNRLAVTLGDEKIIQLLSTEAGLNKTGQIKTEGHCRGIKFSDGHLYVTFDNVMSSRVEVLILRGEVVKTFQFGDTGNILVFKPKCIGFTPDRSQLYVTDSNGIYRISSRKKVTAIFETFRLMGIAVSERGSVFATSKWEDVVYQFEDDLSNKRYTLGIKGAIALAICHARNMLVVSCGSGGVEVCDKLHVFKIV
ncbi:uncharacterized protein LOC128551023 [Mercenaria mercenaria]|uniref:uncharacterized protein LOC128551023 n=1 Tax=Mercenaria mercenaria TaxID=6596 RepID=UPI00234EF4F9|nr:uncharacterized protein LOC128551023 [Mercenaria mercenaria]